MYEVKTHNLIASKMQYCSQKFKKFYPPLAKPVEFSKRLVEAIYGLLCRVTLTRYREKKKGARVR